MDHHIVANQATIANDHIIHYHAIDAYIHAVSQPGTFGYKLIHKEPPQMFMPFFSRQEFRQGKNEPKTKKGVER